MTYWRLHYHLIWATFERQPTLTPQREKMFYGVLYKKAKELDLMIHAAGNTEDHVHIVLSIPPKLSVMECVRHIKGSSAFAINHMPGNEGKFQWQEGYGALTISESALAKVIVYAQHQKEHHNENRIIMEFEEVEEQ